MMQMTPKLVSMKLSRKARKEMTGPSSLLASDSTGPEYPYGLTLTLNEDAIKKLVAGDLPEVGTDLMLCAKVAVVSVSSFEQQGGKPNQSVTLQITDMCLEEEPDDSVIGKLYGGDKT